MTGKDPDRRGKPRSVTIRTYLFGMTAAILLPLALFSAAAVAMLMEAESQAARRGASETARRISLAVEQELSNAETALRVLARSELLQSGDYAGFHERALKARTSESAWIVLFSPDGTNLVNTRQPYGAVLPRRANPERITQALASGKTSVSDVYVGSVTKQKIVTIDHPVPRDVGGPYVLSQIFFTDYFNTSLKSTQPPPGWIIGLFDNQGLTIARSHRSEEYVGKPVTEAVLRASRGQASGELRNVSRDGIEIYTFFVRSPVSGWTVAVGVPVAELERPALRAVGVAAFGLAVALAVGLLAALMHGRRLSNSIAHAAQAATMIGRGDIGPARGLRIEELESLHRALGKAHADLSRETDAREAAEADRAQLYASEQAARTTAEAQNRAKDEFLAMLGHELRNPLSAISGAVAVMERRGEDPQSLAVVSRQTRHLAHIVDDLLDVSRLLSGKILLQREPLDLAAAVARAVHTLEAAGTLRGRDVRTDLRECWIAGDPHRVEQIVTNLVGNAVKYTPAPGSVSIVVEPRGADAVLAVSDQGMGIEPALLPTIFDTFVQGTPALDRAQGGLGLGLALVKRLMALHDGRIEAESGGSGKGSRFTATFVRIERPQGLAAPHPASEQRQGALRVLVVDDHADSRATLCELLELSGYACLQAADGTQALAVAAQEGPDVAIVDIGLPGLSGYDVAQRMRAGDATRAIRLVALTGYGQEQDRQRALAAGFDAHLVKPAMPAVLLSTLARLAAPRGT